MLEQNSSSGHSSFNKKWFLFIGQHHQGPYSIEEMAQLYQDGRITMDTLSFAKGESDWHPLKTHPEFVQIFQWNHSDLEVKRPTALEQAAKDLWQRDLLQETPQLEEVSNLKPAPRPPKAYFQAQKVLEEKSAFLQQMAERKAEDHSLDPQLLNEVLASPPQSTNRLMEESLAAAQVSYEIESPVAVHQQEQEKDQALAQNSEQNSEQEVEQKNQARPINIPWAKLFKGLLATTFLALIIFTLVKVWPLSRSTDPLAAIEQLPPAGKTKLGLIARQTSRADVLASFYYWPVKNVLAVALNRNGPADLSIVLKSVPGKVIADQEVRIRLSGHLKEGRAILLGSDNGLLTPTIPAGQYIIDIEGEMGGEGMKWLLALKRSGLFNFIPQIGDADQKFTYHGVHLVGTDASPQQFLADLLKYRHKKEEQVLKPMMEFMENLNTLKTLNDRLQEEWNKTLQVFKGPKDAILFEKGYAAKVAPLLQALVIEANKKYQNKVEGQTTGEIPEASVAQAEVILQLGKDMGKMAVDMAQLLKQQKQVSAQTKEELQQNFNESWQPLSLALQQKIKELNISMKNLSPNEEWTDGPTLAP